MPVSGIPRAGETIEVTLRCSTSSGQVVREGNARAEAWAPGRGLDSEPDYSVVAEWDPAARGFTAWLDTAGWAPGSWTVQGRVRAVTPRGVADGASEPYALLLRA